MSSDMDWALDADSYAKFTKQFNGLDLNKKFEAPGNVVKLVLDDSELPEDTLRSIWQLSDMNEDGCLSQAEFCVAMKLLDAVKNKEVELPEEVPKALYDTRWGPDTSKLNCWLRKRLKFMTMDEFQNWVKEKFTEEKKHAEIILNVFEGMDGKGVSHALKVQLRVVEVFMEAGLDVETSNDLYTTIAEEDSWIIGREQRIVFDHSSNKIFGEVLDDNLRCEFPFSVRVSSNGKIHFMMLKTGTMQLVDQYNNSMKFKLIPRRWEITDMQRKRYLHRFHGLNLNEDGYVLGTDVRPVLDSSGIEISILSQIWKLSDVDGDGCLSPSEFCIAMHFIDQFRSGEMQMVMDLPFETPEELNNNASSNTDMKLTVDNPLDEWNQKQVEDWFKKREIQAKTLTDLFCAQESKEFTGKDVMLVYQDDFIEKLHKQGIPKLRCSYLFYELMQEKQFEPQPYDDHFFPGVSAKKVKDEIESHSNPSFEAAIDFSDAIKKIVENLGPEEKINSYTWDKMQNSWGKTMKFQLENSNFDFDRIVHRFPDIYPFEFNCMPMHIGSWMGDCFGMMQWPMPDEEYLNVLKNVIDENKVTFIVALGIQNKGERREMVSYWKTIGTSYKEEVMGNCKIYTVTEVGPRTPTVTVCHFDSWPDYGAPLEDLSDFEYMFNQCQQREQNNQRVIIHCRAGVGRSGTFRLMYKTWKKEINVDNLIIEVTHQRARRMWTVQTADQYNFLKKFVYNARRAEIKFHNTLDFGFKVGDDNKVSEVVPESQADEKGVKKGWLVFSICGDEVEGDKINTSVNDYLKKKKSEVTVVSVVFKKD